MSVAKVATADMAVLDEVEHLCRRLRLKYVREQLTDVVLTARAQRWDPAEALRALLVAEAQGRDRSTIESRRRRAHFPAGKTSRAGPTAALRSRPLPSGRCAAWNGWPEPRTSWWPGPRARASPTCSKPSASAPWTRAWLWPGSVSRT